MYDVCLLSSTAIKGWKSLHLFILRVLSPFWPYQALNLCKLVEWTNFRALSLIFKACDFGKHHTHLRKQTPSKIGAKSALMGFNPPDYVLTLPLTCTSPYGLQHYDNVLAKIKGGSVRIRMEVQFLADIFYGCQSNSISFFDANKVS